MSFPLYRDISKKSNDLLRKGYVTAERYAFRVDFDTTSASGTNLTSYLQRTVDNNVDGELQFQCSCKDTFITSTEDTLQNVSVQISPATHLPSGLKWSLNVNSNFKDLVELAKVKASVDYKNDFSNTSLSLEHPLRQPASQKPTEGKAILNSVFGSKEKGISLGFDSELSLSTYVLNGLNTTLAFNKPDIDVAFFSKKRFGSANGLVVGMNYFQDLASSKWTDTQVASEISYDLNDKTSAFALGLSFKPSAASIVKTRYDSKGLLGFLYTEKWNGPLTVAFGADWNILAGAGLQHSVKLTFR